MNNGLFLMASYLVIAAMIWQSMRRRLVGDVRPLVLSGIFLAYGVLALSAAAGGMSFTTPVTLWSTALLALAVGLGAARGMTIRLADVGSTVERRGTILTLGAWALAFAAHAVVRLAMGHEPALVALASGSLVLYAAITHLTQVLVVRLRAVQLLGLVGRE